MSDTAPPVRYRFGRFELQPDERRLLDAGVPVAIGPRAFDLVAALVERAGHLVTKDELLERVWPKMIVEEAALQMQISALRKVLGRDAIATVTGRGYRFALVVASDGAQHSAPSTVPRHNLPQPLTSFIGREQELSELKGLLDTARLLTLTGSGGCGKTRLAMQMAADLTGAYPDGIWLVEFAALADPALVPQAVAQVFGLQEQPGKHLTQTIAEHLASRHLLLVLDNAEHVLEACAQVSDVLLRASAKLRVLVTSRERLGIVGELIYPVPSLSAPGPEQQTTPEQIGAYESVRLFVERAQLQQPQFRVTAGNVAALALVCQRLDGIPLAIELAAARVRSMPVEEVSRRLDQRFDLLTGGSRTALPRHQTLRSLIDWSYALLSGAEQALLCRASIFAGGWTLEAAEQVCVGDGVDGKTLLDLLTSLADKSLILAKEHQGTTRYGLLETVRYYARDRLAERGEEATLTRRHYDYVLSLAEVADDKLVGEGQRLWLECLDAEHDNLRAALAWCCAGGGDAADGLYLAAAVGWFWRSRGHLSEGRRWLSLLIEATSSRPDSPVRADALRRAGILAMDQADYPAAQDLQHEALTIYRRVGDRRGIARSLQNLGLVAMEQAKYSAAQRLLEESMVIYRELGAPLGLLLSNLARVTQQLGDHAKAQALYEEALGIQRTLGDRASIALLTHNLGSTLCFQGDYPRAKAMLKEALAIWDELASRLWLASSLEDFACLAWLQGQAASAARLWGRAASLRDEIGSTRSPSARATLDPHIAAARTAMGNEAFESAWAEGRSLSLDEVTRELLES
ncbi:tetratricopeptide repeat protein [Paucibacter sp. PLA-PC-4]|uniref:ATP-binding protein n=1 Tax=Paucibacter sp. PLA-PC-4 TaxID=2993655 RepID=UPI00224B7201|nr:tetratricopeptide repeat protein [Paucibacter sp. PLA-PC-4]MCX2865609.1 tetratricopeptide repeat protein [Paucibacter sp. PLA-PC-4]